MPTVTSSTRSSHPIGIPVTGGSLCCAATTIGSARNDADSSMMCRTAWCWTLSHRVDACA
jgi:hypothetical protein